VEHLAKISAGVDDVKATNVATDIHHSSGYM